VAILSQSELPSSPWNYTQRNWKRLNHHLLLYAVIVMAEEKNEVKTSKFHEVFKL